VLHLKILDVVFVAEVEGAQVALLAEDLQYALT
jgi:hypothetical protein